MGAKKKSKVDVEIGDVSEVSRKPSVEVEIGRPKDVSRKTDGLTQIKRLLGIEPKPEEMESDEYSDVEVTKPKISDVIDIDEYGKGEEKKRALIGILKRRELNKRKVQTPEGDLSVER